MKFKVGTKRQGFVIGINTLCIDCITTVNRFPEEGQAVRGISQERFPGGKGPNAILAVKKAGAPAKFYSTVHPDDAIFLLKNLKANGIDTKGIKQSESTQTVIANITQHVESGDHTVVTFNGHHEIAAEMIDTDDFNEHNTLMLQAKLSEETLEKLINLADKTNCAITMNLSPVKKIKEDLVKKLDILVINEHEARDINKLYDISNKNQDEELTKELAGYFNVVTVVTRGAKDVLLAVPGNELKIYPSIKVDKVVSTLGAGDAFFGVLTGRLHLGEDIDAALKHAITAGAIVCTKAAPQSCPEIEEIKSLLA